LIMKPVLYNSITSPSPSIARMTYNLLFL
jgi:hypothetical protein